MAGLTLCRNFRPVHRPLGGPMVHVPAPPGAMMTDTAKAVLGARAIRPDDGALR